MNTSVGDFLANLSRAVKRKNSRKEIIFLSCLLCLSILIIPALILEKKSERERVVLQTRLHDCSNLISEYNKLKVQVSAIDDKRLQSKSGSIIQAIDEVISSAGIKEKMKAIKGIEVRDVGGKTSEESAEVQMEKVTLNELVHIFYKIENAPMLLSIKKATMKKSFALPELLDVTMTISLFTGPPVSAK